MHTYVYIYAGASREALIDYNNDVEGEYLKVQDKDKGGTRIIKWKKN